MDTSGFKRGDRVKIMRRADLGDHGWADGWVRDRMDKTIGRTGVVHRVSSGSNAGVMVDVCGERWNYPPFILKKVKRALRTKKAAI